MKRIIDVRPLAINDALHLDRRGADQHQPFGLQAGGTSQALAKVMVEDVAALRCQSFQVPLVCTMSVLLCDGRKLI